jgi:signal transduction histidine kinase
MEFNQELQDKILANTQTGTWSWDIVTNKVYWSPVVENLFDVPHGQFDGTVEMFMSRVYHEDIHILQNKMNEIFSSSIVDYEYEHRVLLRNGAFRWLHCRGFVLRNTDGQPTALVGVSTDNTSRKIAEIDLSQSQLKYKGLFESIIAGVVILDKTGGVVSYNAKATEIFGEDYINNQLPNYYSYTYYNNNNEEIAVSQIPAGIALSTKKDVKNFVLGVKVGLSEKVLWLLVNANVVLDVNNEILEIIISFVDISKQRQELIELENIKKKLEYRNHVLEGTTHILSHNFRNPISNIQVLLSMYSEEKEAATKEYIFNNIVSLSNKLKDTIDILSSSIQIQLEKGTKNAEYISLKETISFVEQNFMIQIQNQQAEIIVDLQNDFLIWFEKAYIQSVFYNLISNALKYSKENIPLRLEIKAEELVNHVVVSFKDNGLGIDLEKYGSKIFGLYKKFHNNEDSKGVGLYLSKLHMESFQGRIEVESTVGEGTEFKVYFLKR